MKQRVRGSLYLYSMQIRISGALSAGVVSDLPESADYVVIGHTVVHLKEVIVAFVQRAGRNVSYAHLVCAVNARFHLLDHFVHVFRVGRGKGAPQPLVVPAAPEVEGRSLIAVFFEERIQMRPVGEVLGIRQLQAAEPLDLLGRLKLAIQVAGP